MAHETRPRHRGALPKIAHVPSNDQQTVDITCLTTHWLRLSKKCFRAGTRNPCTILHNPAQLPPMARFLITCWPLPSHVLQPLCEKHKIPVAGPGIMLDLPRPRNWYTKVLSKS